MTEDTRDSFFGELFKLAKNDKNIIFISADADAFALKLFRDELPDQYISAGVAEQNVVLMAAGLAMAGKKVYIYSIIPFITLRCYEQIKVSICSMNLNVNIIGIGAGYAFSWDGTSHHATQDLALMRTLPGLTILNPIDAMSCKNSAQIAYNSSNPCYVRLDKGSFPDIYEEEDCNNGIKVFSKENAIKLITTGYLGTLVRQLLQKNDINELDIIDLFRIKPINEKLLLDALRNASDIVTLEENSKIGGIGSIICEIVADYHLNIRVHRIALDDVLLEKYGERDWLLAQSGINKKSIIEKIKSLTIKKIPKI